MSKIILTTEEELEALLKKVLNEALSPFFLKGEIGVIKTPSEIMTLKEASEFLNLSRAAIYSQTSKRTIPHFKKGKKIYFKRVELIEWVTQGKRKTKDEILLEWEEKQRLKASRKR